jgi:hypothetical protein
MLDELIDEEAMLLQLENHHKKIEKYWNSYV